MGQHTIRNYRGETLTFERLLLVPSRVASAIIGVTVKLSVLPDCVVSNAEAKFTQAEGVFSREMATAAIRQLAEAAGLLVTIGVPGDHPGARQRRLEEAREKVLAGRLTLRPGKHDLWATGDAGVPEFILDRNGEVVLSHCRTCGRGESQLDEDEGRCPGVSGV